MAKKVKFGKVSIVVFLTALIWVWADLAQDERMDLPGVVFQVAKSSDPGWWVSFVVPGQTPELQTSLALDSVVLKGPASRVAEVSRLKNRGALDLELYVSPEQEKLMQEGDATRDILDLLKRNDGIRKLDLTVESCEPRTLTIRTRKLVKTTVAVECVGLDPSVRVDRIEPPQVEVFVPTDESQTLKATIQLTPAQQEQAKNAPLQMTPYIELVAGQRREVPTPVKVRLAPAENVLRDYSVPATHGFTFSPNLQGKYEVILSNDLTELATVRIKATPDAYRTYAQAPYQWTLYILDTDRQQESVTREFVLTFPEEYVRRGEIKADQPTKMARFRLEPVAGLSPEASGF